jgi:hypothetical protein
MLEQLSASELQLVSNLQSNRNLHFRLAACDFSMPEIDSRFKTEREEYSLIPGLMDLLQLNRRVDELRQLHAQDPRRPAFFVPVSNALGKVGKEDRDEDSELRIYQMFCGCRQRCDLKCLNREMKQECHAGICQLGPDCGNRSISRGKQAVCVVRYAGSKGWGLFASEGLKNGDLVGEYVGEVVDARICHHRFAYNYENDRHFYMLGISDNEIVDATRFGGLCRFVNHSCNPNCAIQKWSVKGRPLVAFFAIKDIRAGEEITADYNCQRFGTKAQTCDCGQPNCRGTIGLRPALHKKKPASWS